jgi:hypothetical protein
MMNIDDPARHALAHTVRQNLHVARENDQFCAGLFDDLNLAGFGLGLVLFGHSNVVKWNVVIDDDLLAIQVI